MKEELNLEDFRKISGVFPEQILAKATLDSTGYFIFKGDNLPLKNRIYRIHIDTCNENEQLIDIVEELAELILQYGMPDALGAAMHSVTLLATKPIVRSVR